MSQDTVFKLPDEDQVLAYTHNKRKIIVDTLMTKGVPEDVGTAKVLIATLDGMDKSALTRKKIKVEERANVHVEQAATIIAKILTMGAATNAFKTAEPVERVIPTLPTEIPDPVLVDGETSVVGSNHTFETFMAANSREV